MNFDSYTDAQLVELQNKIDEELARNAAAKRQQALDEVLATLRAHNVTAAELKGLAKQLKSKPKKSPPPKYAHPEDATKTWTGRGREPVWLQQDKELTGRPTEFYLIKAPESQTSSAANEDAAEESSSEPTNSPNSYSNNLEEEKRSGGVLSKVFGK